MMDRRSDPRFLRCGLWRELGVQDFASWLPQGSWREMSPWARLRFVGKMFFQTFE